MQQREWSNGEDKDLIRDWLGYIVDISHPLLKLATAVEWDFQEQRFEAGYVAIPLFALLPRR